MRELAIAQKLRAMVTKKYAKWVILALTGILAALFLVWVFAFHETGPIPRKYRSGLSFQLYYPSHLPDGFTVDPKSYKREGDVLIFVIKSEHTKGVSVAEQAVPASMPVHQISTTPFQIPGERTFSTNIGQGHLGLWGANYVADIVTDETWIIMNVTGLTADQATPLTQSFSKLK